MHICLTILFQLFPLHLIAHGCLLLSIYPETFFSEILAQVPIQDRLKLRLTCRDFYNLLQVHPKLRSELKSRSLSHISNGKSDGVIAVKKLFAEPGYYNLDFRDAEDRGLLYWAVFAHGSLELVKYLFKKGASFKNPAVMKKVLDCIMYCHNGDTIFQFLIGHDCVLGVPGQWNFLSLVVLMAKKPFFDIFLQYDKVEEWIHAVDSHGRTPLFSAKRYSVAKTLLDNGANVLAKDHYGCTTRESLRNELRSSVDINLDQLLASAENYSINR